MLDMLLVEIRRRLDVLGELGAGAVGDASAVARDFHFSLMLLNAALCATLVSLIGSGGFVGALPSAINSCCRANDAASRSLS